MIIEELFRKTGCMVVLMVVGLVSLGCITTGTFHTGRTLDPGQFQLVGGVQQLAGQGDDGLQFLKESEAMVPRLGVNAGLPWRFEIGTHLLYGQGVEGQLFFELTPRSFDYFDLSVGYVRGLQWSGGYQKLGGALSVNLDFVEPYAFYYEYKTTHSNWDGFDEDIQWLNDVVSGISAAVIDGSRSVGTGARVPLGDGLVSLMPEFRYDIYDYLGDNGIETSGVGYFGVCFVLGE